MRFVLYTFLGLARLAIILGLVAGTPLLLGAGGLLDPLAAELAALLGVGVVLALYVLVMVIVDGRVLHERLVGQAQGETLGGTGERRWGRGETRWGRGSRERL